VALWPVCFLIASLVSTPLNLLLSGGRSGVALGDAFYAYLLNAHFPAYLAAFLGEAAVDIPDKLLTVVVAMLIYRALPTQSMERSNLELDIGQAFVFVFRSSRWLVKLLVAGLCLLFFWLVIPFLLFTGYAVAVARGVRAGDEELPRWDHLRQKLKDGFLITALFVVWNLPGILLGIPAELAAGIGNGAGGQGMRILIGALSALATLGGLWGLVVLMAQAAIWGQYLKGGFGAALNPAAVVRRVRFHAGLTVVVGALALVLAGLAFSGIVVVIGVLLTLPYASWVSAHLFGKYARLTDEAATVVLREAAPA
jgi:hypothetical protein